MRVALDIVSINPNFVVYIPLASRNLAQNKKTTSMASFSNPAMIELLAKEALQVAPDVGLDSSYFEV